MPGQKIKTSRVLMIIAVLFSLLIGASFRQSGVETSFSIKETDTEVIVGDNKNITKEETKPTPVPTALPTPTKAPTPKPTEAPKKKVKASKEASKGVWTPSGSNWLFLVNGTAYTGWLVDTDGKQYYFGQDGIMQTGWLDEGGKRYYLDADGIKQTGDITVDGETYHLNEDGSLDGVETKSNEETEKKTQKKAEKGTAGTIALTFDDGPSSFTDRILDCLEKNNARATFFMVGEEIKNFPEAVTRMEALGCELGNHSYKHTDFTTLSPEDMSAEVAAVDELLVGIAGHGATVLRPPYGSVNDSVRATIGTPMILWSIDTLDWETKDAEKTVDTVMENVKDGSVILMHDIYSTTADAVEILVPQLISAGYELVTVHELAAKKGVELQTGITYGSFE